MLQFLDCCQLVGRSCALLFTVSDSYWNLFLHGILEVLYYSRILHDAEVAMQFNVICLCLFVFLLVTQKLPFNQQIYTGIPFTQVHYWTEANERVNCSFCYKFLNRLILQIRKLSRKRVLWLIQVFVLLMFWHGNIVKGSCSLNHSEISLDLA